MIINFSVFGIVLLTTALALSPPAPPTLPPPAPPTPNVAISLAQDFLSQGTGFYSPPTLSFLSSDFVFRGGVVGPLNRDDYMRTMTTLNVPGSFSLQSNAFGFVVDPEDPYTVRFFLRNTGKHESDWQPWGKFPPIPLKRTGNEVLGPTEAGCVTIDPKEPTKIKFFNTGNVLRFGSASSNTGGLGAVLGLFHAIGFGDIGNMALIKQVRDGSNWMGGLADVVPLTRSKAEAVPSWYKE